MPRRRRILLLALGALGFVVISLAVARVLTVGNAERDAVVDAVRARAGRDIRVLRFDGPGGVALTGHSGTARIAWKAGQELPIVQCARLRTDGDPLRGYSVRVLTLGPPIGGDASCQGIRLGPRTGAGS